MKEFKKKNQIKKRIYSKFTIFVLLVILFFILNGVWGVFLKSKESQKKMEVTRGEYESLKQRHTSISERVSFLNTEAGIESEIRNKYDVSKNEEKVIVIVEDKEKVKEEEIIEKEKGFWGKMVSWFVD